MVFLAGVDEAGYGPLLGPLVVGFSAFRVPDFDTDLWRALGRLATQKPRRMDRRLRVDDSKRVFSGPYGRERLERSVAAFRSAYSDGGDGLAEWLAAPPAGPTRWFARAPWFRDLEGPLCPGADPGRRTLDAARLAAALEDHGCKVETFGARAVPAAEWNDFLRRHGGKGDALFAVTVEVLRHILAVTGGAPLRVELDRHGARTRYAARLQSALEPVRIETHAEGEGGSLYTLYFPDREVQLRFTSEADGHHFPVALASLAAKQTRERLMDLWNAWFGARLPQLRPTRGYALDARRWLVEAGEAAGRLGVDETVLKRRL